MYFTPFRANSRVSSFMDFQLDTSNVEAGTLITAVFHSTVNVDVCWEPGTEAVMVVVITRTALP